jgi:Uma2 family endonuclease
MKFINSEIDIEVRGDKNDGMTDEEFFIFCVENRDLRIERDCNRQIYITAPVNLEGGNRNGKIFGYLFAWNLANQLGECFESSTGYTLPDNSVSSPDASWMPAAKWAAIPKKERQKHTNICPDFIIELKSKTDSIRYLKNKMLKWIENGCQLAWLIIPEKEEAHIYRVDGSIEIVKGFNKKLSGENILTLFTLDLRILL